MTRKASDWLAFMANGLSVGHIVVDTSGLDIKIDELRALLIECQSHPCDSCKRKSTFVVDSDGVATRA